MTGGISSREAGPRNSEDADSVLKPFFPPSPSSDRVTVFAEARVFSQEFSPQVSHSHCSSFLHCRNLQLDLAALLFFLLLPKTSINHPAALADPHSLPLLLVLLLLQVAGSQHAGEAEAEADGPDWSVQERIFRGRARRRRRPSARGRLGRRRRRRGSSSSCQSSMPSPTAERCLPPPPRRP